jgi:hypothetical protein
VHEWLGKGCDCMRMGQARAAQLGKGKVTGYKKVRDWLQGMIKKTYER